MKGNKLLSREAPARQVTGSLDHAATAEQAKAVDTAKELYLGSKTTTRESNARWVFGFGIGGFFLATAILLGVVGGGFILGLLAFLLAVPAMLVLAVLNTLEGRKREDEERGNHRTG